MEESEKIISNVLSVRKMISVFQTPREWCRIICYTCVYAGEGSNRDEYRREGETEREHCRINQMKLHRMIWVSRMRGNAPHSIESKLFSHLIRPQAPDREWHVINQMCEQLQLGVECEGQKDSCTAVSRFRRLLNFSTDVIWKQALESLHTTHSMTSPHIKKKHDSRNI